MKKVNFIVWLALTGLFAVSFAEIPAQTRKKRLPSSKKTLAVGKTQAAQKSPLQCTTKNTGDQTMTYLVGAGRISKKDKKRIEKSWGKLIIPQGETERAKEIRQQALNYQNTLVGALNKSLETWKKANPNATAEQIEAQRRLRQERIDYKLNKNTEENKKRLAARRWDWRTLLDIRPALDQGKNCNTCWAFAASDAAALSIQKNLMNISVLRDYIFPDRTTGELSAVLSPDLNMRDVTVTFVQDLLNCMPIPEREICRSGWHGRAFDYMVYGRGVPLTYGDGFVSKNAATGQNAATRLVYQPNRKFACQPSAGFRKAASWDYVNAPPDELPSVEQLKTALVEHGPLVAPIVYDECLAKYKSGVFNEQNLGMINHAVLLIGWDDAKEAWLVKNSWGEEWGENGFAWIKYGSNNIGVFAAWIDAVGIN